MPFVGLIDFRSKLVAALLVNAIQELFLTALPTLPQVHVTTYTDATMMSADEDSTSSPDDDPYDDTDILNSAGTDEITAHLAAAG